MPEIVNHMATQMRTQQYAPCTLLVSDTEEILSDKGTFVLFMVIEKFKAEDLQAAGERFARQGRMLPEDVSYESSWMEPGGQRCFQVMRAPTAASLEPWIARWSDLVEFEVIPVMPSAEFWATRP